MKTRLALVLLVALVALPPGSPAQTGGGFVVVVNAANPVREVERTHVAKIFFKKYRRWDGGVPIVVVDQRRDSPVRLAFTRGVHGKNVSATGGPVRDGPGASRR